MNLLYTLAVLIGLVCVSTVFNRMIKIDWGKTPPWKEALLKLYYFALGAALYEFFTFISSP